jgi:hypothetical protein
MLHCFALWETKKKCFNPRSFRNRMGRGPTRARTLAPTLEILCTFLLPPIR